MIYEFNNKTPKIHDSAFVADYVALIGDVTLGENVSVWFNTTLRGDVGSITIGSSANVQENSTLHMSHDGQIIIEENVTIGHGCIIHGATIRKNALIGMGTTILDGAEIGEGALIGAGSLVPPGKVIPPGVLALGSPVKVIRELTTEELQGNIDNAIDYQEKAVIYKEMQAKRTT